MGKEVSSADEYNEIEMQKQEEGDSSDCSTLSFLDKVLKNLYF